jgi:hypothetical protein
MVAQRLEMGEDKTLNEAQSLAKEVSKMLGSFIEKLRPATRKLKAES